MYIPVDQKIKAQTFIEFERKEEAYHLWQMYGKDRGELLEEYESETPYVPEELSIYEGKVYPLPDGQKWLLWQDFKHSLKYGILNFLEKHNLYKY